MISLCLTPFRQILKLNLELGWQPMSPSDPIFLSPAPSLWGYRLICNYTRLLTWVLGIQPRSSGLLCKCFYLLGPKYFQRCHPINHIFLLIYFLWIKNILIVSYSNFSFICRILFSPEARIFITSHICMLCIQFPN